MIDEPLEIYFDEFGKKIKWEGRELNAIILADRKGTDPEFGLEGHYMDIAVKAGEVGFFLPETLVKLNGLDFHVIEIDDQHGILRIKLHRNAK